MAIVNQKSINTLTEKVRHHVPHTAWQSTNCSQDLVWLLYTCLSRSRFTGYKWTKRHALLNIAEKGGWLSYYWKEVCIVKHYKTLNNQEKKMWLTLSAQNIHIFTSIREASEISFSHTQQKLLQSQGSETLLSLTSLWLDQQHIHSGCRLLPTLGNVIYDTFV